VVDPTSQNSPTGAPGPQPPLTPAEQITFEQGRLLSGAVPSIHRVTYGRDLRRRCTPARSAKPHDLTIAAVDGGVWLDIKGKAGILFSPDDWGQLTGEAIAVLFELASQQLAAGQPT
jgi:hypothetical protein